MCSREGTPVPIELKTGWAPEPGWTILRRQKSLTAAGIWTSHPRPCSLVAIPTVRHRCRLFTTTVWVFVFFFLHLTYVFLPCKTSYKWVIPVYWAGNCSGDLTTVFRRCRVWILAAAGAILSVIFGFPQSCQVHFRILYWFNRTCSFKNLSSSPTTNFVVIAWGTGSAIKYKPRNKSLQ